MSNTKTLRSLAKRIKFSGTGKVMHRRAGKSHNNTSKTVKRKRFLNRTAEASPQLTRKVKALVTRGTR
jgi:large subunit ribosomal protein L35